WAPWSQQAMTRTEAIQQATPERSPMRRRIGARALFAAAVTIATFTIWSSSTRAPNISTGYSGRLVSIQSMQTDYGDMCYAARIDPFEKNAELPAGNLGNLFGAFDDTAHAA